MDWAGSWLRLPVVVDGISQHHVVPQADLMVHTLAPECPCHPEEDDEAPDLWLHFARDGREEYEAGRPMH